MTRLRRVGANESGRVLIVGSFPPVGGPAASASVAAVRRAWAEGLEVTTASLRPGAADMIARVSGPLAGQRLGRAHRAAPPADRLVLNLETAMLRGAIFPAAARATTIVTMEMSLLGLLPVMRRFDHVTILLTEPLGLPARLLRPLWSSADAVILPSGTDAAVLAPGAPANRVKIAEPYPHVPVVRGTTVLGPPEVLPGQRLQVLAGKAGRALLGPHFLRAREVALRFGRRQ